MNVATGTTVLIGTLIIIGGSSCEKQEEPSFSEDSEGAIISMPHQWKTSLNTNGELIDGFLDQSIVYNGGVLLASQDGNTSKMAMLSSTTGKIEWQWDDFFEEDQDFDVSRLYQSNNYLAFQNGNRAYTLDLSDGTTVRKTVKEHYITGMSGIGDTYFATGNTALEAPQPYQGGIYIGMVNKPTEELLLMPTYSYEYVDGNGVTGFITGISAFRDKNDDILIAYGFADPLPGWQANIYAGLYNYTQRKEVFTKQSLVSNVNSYGSGTPMVYKERVYFSPDRSIVCLDLYTGERLWEKEFDQGFTFSGFILADDKIIANNEDTYLYALDPETGQRLWKEKSSGTSSRMAYLHGVVYYVGGGDGLLHAVDVDTGRHLWRVRSPDEKVNSGAWFMPVVTVLPPATDEEKGKVLVSSYLSAFCYEAAR